jgi:Ser/Thr protein kinase RdoA (MazF antagonist)
MIMDADLRAAGVALGSPVTRTRHLTGGFSHETLLVTLEDGRCVVARLGGPDPAIEAAVMQLAGEVVPVPEVLSVWGGENGANAGPARPGMAISFIGATPLSEVLEADELSAEGFRALGLEVGAALARIGMVTLERPGFFTDDTLAVSADPPWSEQLPAFAEQCMAATADIRLDGATRRAWAGMCREHAPLLRSVDARALLVHADYNPKNLLVARHDDVWHLRAVLDWEFSYAGCPLGDLANMARFGADYPEGFLRGVVDGFSSAVPDLPEDWQLIGRVLDMFALSDLVTRPVGHVVADQSAGVIRQWVTNGVPKRFVE